MANTSFVSDTKIKLEKYAGAGIKDFWIAKMNKRQWIVHRNPSRGKYRTVKMMPFDKALAPLAFPDDLQVWLH
jgi:hypothetical protein